MHSRDNNVKLNVMLFAICASIGLLIVGTTERWIERVSANTEADREKPVMTQIMSIIFCNRELTTKYELTTTNPLSCNYARVLPVL